MTKITIPLSPKNEATAYPWWAILDPRYPIGLTSSSLADMITGPYFSREEAQQFLDQNAHHFSKKARVWCLSGHRASTYKAAIMLSTYDGDIQEKA